MSKKYLGDAFDIHGGGMDLIPTHHTNEIAQSIGCCGATPVNYWVHTNMLTLNGQKMSRSLGNVFLPVELFTGMKLAVDSPSATPSQAKLDGKHPLFEKAFSPITVRFFMLQTHYRSTLDFSSEALRASEKGFKKIINGLVIIKGMKYELQQDVYNEQLNKDIERLCSLCYAGMNDDFNSAITIANLFNLLKYINSFHNKILQVASLSEKVFTEMKKTYIVFVEDILGLKEEKSNNPNLLNDVIDVLLVMYKNAKETKDFATVDLIRKKVKQEGIVIKDTKNGAEWSYEE